MRHSLPIFCMILLVGSCWGRTVVFEDSIARAIISRALKETFMMEYDKALQSTEELRRHYPNHAVYPLMRVGVLYCRMLDYEDLEDIDEFERWFDIAWKKTKELSESGETAEANLYQGVLLGFRALLHQRLGEWWSSVRVGIKAAGHMKACLEQDSSYADAYLGVGTYKYWASRAMDFINWLPFIPDQKEEGIELMRRAMNEGLFGREISRSTLAWTLIDYNRPIEAVKLSIEGLKHYPGSRFYLWTLADGYFQMGRLQYAAQVYQQLYDSIHPLKRNNYYNELGICRKMGQIYLALNKPEDALTWAERGLSRPLNDFVKKRRKKTLEVLQQIKEEARKRTDRATSKP